MNWGTKKKLYVGVSDKIVMPYLRGKELMDCSDEGEAVAIAAGHWLQTGRRAEVFMSADGFCNALNAITSWVIPEEIEMDIVISTGRQEPSHKIMSDILEDLLNLIQYDPERINFKLVEKKQESNRGWIIRDHKLRSGRDKAQA